MFHRGQQAGRFIARRLDHPTVELCQGRCHACIPTDVIAGLSQLFHKDEVALRVHRDEAQAVGTRFILGHGEVFVGHRLGQAWGLGVGLVDDRLCNVHIDLLLRAIGGGHKAVQTCQA